MLARRFAQNEQPNVLIGVVDEGVRDAGVVVEGDAVAFLERMQVAVDPEVGRAFEDEEELLLVAISAGDVRAPCRL